MNIIENNKLILPVVTYRITDSIQECCRCSDSYVSTVTVNLVNDLLTSVEQLSKGQGLSEDMILEIHKQYREVEGTYKIYAIIKIIILI